MHEDRKSKHITLVRFMKPHVHLVLFYKSQSLSNWAQCTNLISSPYISCSPHSSYHSQLSVINCVHTCSEVLTRCPRSHHMFFFYKYQSMRRKWLVFLCLPTETRISGYQLLFLYTSFSFSKIDVDCWSMMVQVDIFSLNYSLRGRNWIGDIIQGRLVNRKFNSCTPQTCLWKTADKMARNRNKILV